MSNIHLSKEAHIFSHFGRVGQFHLTEQVKLLRVDRRPTSPRRPNLKMTATIDVKSLSTVTSTTDVHHVPCDIDHDGEAKVSKYFVTGIRGETGIS